MNIPQASEIIDRLRRDPLPLVFAILSLVTVAPIWWFTYQPMPDHGNHMAAVSILRHIHDPAWDFAQYYQISIGLVPYWGFYAPAYLLSWVMPLSLANRIILSFYAVGLPAGMWLLARRFGRSPWLSLFAFPLAWNHCFVIGFSSFSVCLSLLPFALVVFVDFCERPGWIRGVAAALFGCVLYLSHLLPWGAYLGCAGLIGLLHPGLSPRRFAQRLVVWLPSVVLALAVTGLSNHLNLGRVSHGHLAGSWLPLRERILHVNTWIIGYCPGYEGDWFAAILLLAWLALRLTAPRQRRSLAELRPLACFVTAATAYFVLPRSLTSPAYWYGVNIRFAPIAALFLSLCVSGPILRWRRLLLVPVALVAVALTIDTFRHWSEIDREMMADYHRLASLPRPGSRVLFVVHGRQPGSPFVSFSHAPMHQAFHGGYMPWNFDDGFPIRYRVRYPTVFVRSFDFVWDKHARYYDYIMAWHANPRNLFGVHQQEVVNVASSGKWTLWQLPGPRVDVPPRPPYPAGWEIQ